MDKPMNPELLRGIRFFTRETEIMSGLTVACGAGSRTEWAEDGEDIRETTVYDLASVTKLFTGLASMRLRELGKLDFSRPANAYDPRFEKLGDVSVWQLLTFAANLQTPGRIDACPDRESALRCLFGAENAGSPGRRPYSDIPAMVMKYVIEAASGLPFYETVKRLILEPAGMTETWAAVPEERLADCQSYAGEYRIEKEKHILRTGPDQGIPHDPKAGILQGRSGDLCGHAGLFSTRPDLIRFCRAVLGERIVSGASLREMAVNRTGRKMPDGTWSQFLGILCYVRHPNQYFSEIPEYMGAQAFGIGGFTGNHLSLDPETDRFTIFLGNRVLNRLTVLLPEEGKTLTDYGLREDGVGRILRDDGVWVPSSVQYVHQKDAHLHSVIAKIL